MTATLLAFDLGTTGCKACLVCAETGQVIGSAQAAYPTRFFGMGAAEQNPSDWERAVVQTCQDLHSAAPEAWSGVVAVGCSGQMNGVALVDREGKALRPAIIHADTRSVGLCSRLETEWGRETVFEATGNRLDPHLSLPKAAWLVREEPSVVARAAFLVQAKDYLTAFLTGCVGVTDPSDASLTGGFDVSRRRWADALWESAKVPVRLLPDVLRSSDVLGTVTARASRATFIAAGTPVVVGAGDGACSTAGAGVGVGEGYCALGGTSWVGLRTLAKVADSRLSHYCSVDETLTVFGAVQSAGSALDWLKALLTPPGGLATPAAWDAEAAQVPMGSRGLCFLPYFQGERSPLWDACARGAYIGLTTLHGRPELYRAALEGIGYALRSVLAVFAENGHALPELRLLGGGAGSALWTEILANVFRRRLHILSDSSSATSLGAAMVAAKGIGLVPTWDAARQWAQVTETVSPVEALANAYAPRFALFQTLYPLLKDTFATLAQQENSS